LFSVKSLNTNIILVPPLLRYIYDSITANEAAHCPVKPSKGGCYPCYRFNLVGRHSSNNL